MGIERGIVNVPASIVGDDSTEKGGQSKTQNSNPTAASTTGSTESALPDSDTSSSEQQLVTISLDSSDSIYSEIRDLSIERLGGYLQERAIGVRQRYAAFRENKDASISEIHDFVKKIPQLTKEYKSLNQHINIAELVKQLTDSREFRERWQGERGLLEGEGFLDQLEDLISVDVEGKNKMKNLRLLCLQSVTAGGVRSGKYDSIRRQLIQAYGYEMLYTINNLERAGRKYTKALQLLIGLHYHDATVDSIPFVRLFPLFLFIFTIFAAMLDVSVMKYLPCCKPNHVFATTAGLLRRKDMMLMDSTSAWQATKKQLR
jgi:biopolymer transport protein ExbD